MIKAAVLESKLLVTSEPSTLYYNDVMFIKLCWRLNKGKGYKNND